MQAQVSNGSPGISSPGTHTHEDEEEEEDEYDYDYESLSDGEQIKELKKRQMQKMRYQLELQIADVNDWVVRLKPVFVQIFTFFLLFNTELFLYVV